MNDIQSIHTQYQQISDLVEKQRLKEALTQLESYLWLLPNWELKSRFEQLNTSYSYMLQYMRQGIADPERNKLYRQLCRNTLEIAAQVHLLLLDKESGDYFHECRRNLAGKSVPLKELLQILESFGDDLAVSKLMSGSLDQLLKRHEETQRKWFQQLWTSLNWSNDEEQCMQQALQSATLSITDLCLAVSATTLHLMQHWDVHKFMWLADTYQQKKDNAAGQRALIGIILALYFNARQIHHYPEVKERISAISEQEPFSDDILRIYRQLLLSLETEKIDKQMREEIIPEMLRNVSTLKNRRFGFEESDEEKDDLNPDWDKMMENSGLEEKMRQMSELQMEGADVYMSTFAQLKTLPFFHDLHNWFIPFDTNHSVVIGKLGTENRKKSVIDLIMSSGFFCNSDKYSLLLMLSQFPQSQQDMIFSQLTDQQMEGLAEFSKTETLKDMSERPATWSNQYIHDLYRFYKLYPRRQGFPNPFQESLELENTPILGELLQSPQHLLSLAEFHLKKEHWKKAVRLLETITAQNGETSRRPELYQKTGYAYQKMKQPLQAIQAYQKADTIKPDNNWTLKHLATCYRQTQQYAEALNLYRKLENDQPDHPQITYHIALCLAELEQYHDALNYFFKLDYLEGESPRAWRGIAWCSFVTGKYEQATKYYEKIRSGKPLAVDNLNAAHVTWVTGNIEQAATLYSQARAACENREQFMEMFDKDRQLLCDKGINPDDIPLMLDLLL